VNRRWLAIGTLLLLLCGCSRLDQSLEPPEVPYEGRGGNLRKPGRSWVQVGDSREIVVFTDDGNMIYSRKGKRSLSVNEFRVNMERQMAETVRVILKVDRDLARLRRSRTGF
jgi:hypothetical protein